MGEVFITRRGAGNSVKRQSGTFTTNSSGNATVNCGFKPDFVLIHINLQEDGYYDSLGAAFTERNQKVLCTGWLTYQGGDYSIMDLELTQTSTGFSVKAYRYNWDWDYSNLSRTFNYVAVKYT